MGNPLETNNKNVLIAQFKDGVKKAICIKKYTANSQPKPYVVEAGEELELVGNLMGMDATFRLDPKLHPPHYKHLTHCHFVVFSKRIAAEHFKIID